MKLEDISFIYIYKTNLKCKYKFYKGETVIVISEKRESDSTDSVIKSTLLVPYRLLRDEAALTSMHTYITSNYSEVLPFVFACSVQLAIMLVCYDCYLLRISMKSHIFLCTKTIN